MEINNEYWLVVEPPNPSKKWWSSSVGMIIPFPTEWKITHVPNHQPDENPHWYQVRLIEGLLSSQSINHIHGIDSMKELTLGSWHYMALVKSFAVTSSTMRSICAGYTNQYHIIWQPFVSYALRSIDIHQSPEIPWKSPHLMTGPGHYPRLSSRKILPRKHPDG